jgi:integration host factor subunit alpha
MALTKADIITAVQTEEGITKQQGTEIIETLIEIVKSTLETGEDVLISGFGKFCVREKSERKGRNPATGNDLMLSPRKVVTFKCSGKLRDRINR